MKPIARLIFRNDGENNGLVLGSILKNQGECLDFSQTYEIRYDNFFGSGFSLVPVGKSSVQQVTQKEWHDYPENRFIRGSWFSDVSNLLNTGREIFFTQDEIKMIDEMNWLNSKKKASENDEYLKISYQDERFFIKIHIPKFQNYDDKYNINLISFSK